MVDANWVLVGFGFGVLLGWVLGTIATMDHYYNKFSKKENDKTNQGAERIP